MAVILGVNTWSTPLGIFRAARSLGRHYYVRTYRVVVGGDVSNREIR